MVLSIETNYNDAYSHVSLYTTKGTIDFGQTGDVIKDWYEAVSHASGIMRNEKTEIADTFCVYSSSVDHYIMDNKNIHTAYAFPNEKNEWELSYKYLKNAYMVFVPSEEEITFEQYRTYCKNC